MKKTNKKAVSAATEHGKEMCIHTNPTCLVYTKERNLSNNILGGDTLCRITELVPSVELI